MTLPQQVEEKVPEKEAEQDKIEEHEENHSRKKLKNGHLLLSNVMNIRCLEIHCSRALAPNSKFYENYLLEACFVESSLKPLKLKIYTNLHM